MSTKKLQYFVIVQDRKGFYSRRVYTKQELYRILWVSPTIEGTILLRRKLHDQSEPSTS